MKTKLGPILLIIRIYFLVLSIFFVFRAILFLTWTQGAVWTTDVLRSFVMGIRFDVVISGYILILPALILLVSDFFVQRSQAVKKVLFAWLFGLFSVAFMVCAADIPYFHQFFARFSVGAFKWMDSPAFVLNMILEEPKYFLYALPWLGLVIYFFRRLRKILFQDYTSSIKWPIKATTSVLFLGLMFLGIRGRIEKKSPIRTGTAYFGHDPFLNQLGLNPVFTLMRSYLDSTNPKNKEAHLMDNQKAIQNTQQYLGIPTSSNESLLARKIDFDSISSTSPNVILIIMESMSTAKMARHGSTQNLTPFLDSLTNESIYFDHIYTAGEHTFNGIFSSLFSFPALYRQHPLKTIRHFDGIATTLKSQGYSTAYFTTHDGQFDNVEGFLRFNDFDQVISQANYPPKEIKTTLGVPDDYMFRFSIPIINDLHKKGQPFFVSFMTTSDHGPYYIPPYYHPRTTTPKTQVIEFADWSLRKMIDLSSKEDWFANTIFVFVADHGAPMNVKYDISLNYHHTPLLFYAPKLLSPNLLSHIGGQIDIYPSIMGLLHKPFTNNTLGIDLFSESRPYIFINGDDKVAALDTSFLYILLADGHKRLYKYKQGDTKNYINDYPEKAQEMDKYLRSNLQTFQALLSE